VRPFAMAVEQLSKTCGLVLLQSARHNLHHHGCGCGAIVGAARATERRRADDPPAHVPQRAHSRGRAAHRVHPVGQGDRSARAYHFDGSARPTSAASYPVSVCRVATLLHASFRQSLAVLPLRFAGASPSIWLHRGLASLGPVGNVRRTRDVSTGCRRCRKRYPRPSA
jgi:hypothetical protein